MTGIVQRPLLQPIVVNAVLMAVRQAANILCDRWTLLTLIAAHAGVTRFADFRQTCGVANRLLTTRLLMLEEQEVLVRLAYSRRPLRHSYHLTHMGLGLFDVFAAMLVWEQRWYPECQPGLALEHMDCGQHAVHPEIRCGACGTEVQVRDLSVKVDQKKMEAMAKPVSTFRRSTMGTHGHQNAKKASLPEALEIFGDKWSIEVVMCAMVGVTTFGEFQSHTGMSTNILADRLARLGACNILVSSQNQGGLRRGTYRLTPKGRDLVGVLVCIERWADTWLRDRTRAPTRLFHVNCGKRLDLVVRCGSCQQPLVRAGCKVHL